MSTLVLEDIGASTPGLPLRLQFDSNDGCDFEIDENGGLNLIPDNGTIKLFENPATGSLFATIRIFATGTPFVAGDLRLEPSGVGGSVGNTQTNGKMGAGVTSNSAMAAQSDETNGAPIFNGINNAASGTRQILRANYNDVTPNDEVSRFLHCLDNTTLRMQIWSNGDVENINNNYGALSDEGLKQGIRDANSQWDDFKAMRFRKWKFNAEVEQRGDDAKECLGVVGQEMQGVSPGLVKTTTVREVIEETILDDGSIVSKITTKDDGPPILSVAYSVLYMKGMVALQEAMQRIEVLEAAV
jgi:hypothetical protein